MKIAISVVVLAVVVVAVVIAVRSIGDDVGDIRQGFESSPVDTEVPANAMELIGWEVPIYSTLPPDEPEGVKFETHYCWLGPGSERFADFRCRGTVTTTSQGIVQVKCEGFPNEAESHKRRPDVTASKGFAIGRLLHANWEVSGEFESIKDVFVGRCAVFEWPS